VSIVARRAWQVLLILAAVITLLGIGDMLGGVAFEPTTPLAISGQSIDQIQAGSPAAYRVIDFGARHGGINLAIIGVLLAALAWFPYRACRRWAWFANVDAADLGKLGAPGRVGVRVRPGPVDRGRDAVRTGLHRDRGRPPDPGRRAIPAP
jgi:hypothetical protein